MSDFTPALKSPAETDSAVKGLVGRERALITAKLGFPEGGYRTCLKDAKMQKVTVEQVAEFLCNGLPRCLICKGRTELLTPDEVERTK